jgi:hypothetical protein
VHHSLDTDALRFVENDARSLDVCDRVTAGAVYDRGYTLHRGSDALHRTYVALHDLNRQSPDPRSARPSPNASSNGSRIQLVQHLHNPTANEPTGARNKDAIWH